MTDSEMKYRAMTLGPKADYLAPDGSEIRLLPSMTGGGLCHCTLGVGKTSAPVSHRQVEEIWYITGGEGEIWRRNLVQEESVQVRVGSCLTIPPHTAFQFRNTGDCPLSILIVTMPPWPGPEEAEVAQGIWPASLGALLSRE